VLSGAALAVAIAGGAHAATNQINCVVDVVASTGNLAVVLSHSTWDLDAVPQGGVKDSWFGEATHGKFWVRNSGDTNACIFIVALPGGGGNPLYPTPVIPPPGNYYALCVATNVTGVLPVWTPLDHEYASDKFGRHMRRLLPGDYMLFDLRFFVGPGVTADPGKTFAVGVWAALSESEPPAP
jgi:hypothetical protein